MPYLKSHKAIYIDLCIRELSTPDVEKHKHKWYP